jgi:hypothetical protein
VYCSTSRTGCGLVTQQMPKRPPQNKIFKRFRTFSNFVPTSSNFSSHFFQLSHTFPNFQTPFQDSYPHFCFKNTGIEHQASSIEDPAPSIQHRVSRGFQSNPQRPTANNPNILIFLTALQKTSYEYRDSRIKDFFHPNRAPCSTSDRTLCPPYA